MFSNTILTFIRYESFVKVFGYKILFVIVASSDLVSSQLQIIVVKVNTLANQPKDHLGLKKETINCK